MNRKQLAVLWIGIILLAVAVLMPPWKQTFQADDIYSEKPLGYSLVFKPPPAEGAVVYGVQVDMPRLCITLGGIVIVAVGLIVAFADRPPRSKRAALNVSGISDNAEQTPPITVNDGTTHATPAIASDDVEQTPPVVGNSSKIKPGRVLFWINIPIGITVQWLLTRNPDASLEGIIAELTENSIYVFIFAVVGACIVGIVVPDRDKYGEAVGGLLGIAFSIFAVIYLLAP